MYIKWMYMYLNETLLDHNTCNPIPILKPFHQNWKLFVKTTEFYEWLKFSLINTYIFIFLDFGCFGQMYDIFQQAVQEVESQVSQFLCKADGLSVSGTVCHCLYQQGQGRLQLHQVVMVTACSGPGGRGGVSGWGTWVICIFLGKHLK